MGGPAGVVFSKLQYRCRGDEVFSYPEILEVSESVGALSPIHTCGLLSYVFDGEYQGDQGSGTTSQGTVGVGDFVLDFLVR